MSAALAGACAAAAVLAALARPVPPPRVLALRVDRSARRGRDVVAGAGRVVRAPLGLRPDQARDRRAGAGLVLAVVALALGLPVALAAGAVALLRRRWRRVLRARSGPVTANVERDLPDLVDLLALAVGAGVSVPAALAVVAPVAPVALRPGLGGVVDAMAGGRSCDEAVAGLDGSWGPAALPLVHTLADHLRYGTPALPALERVAAEARTRRRRAAETRARKLPVLLLFPLVLCTLPAFGLLTVAPLVAGTFDSLTGGPLEAPASLGP